MSNHIGQEGQEIFIRAKVQDVKRGKKRAAFHLTHLIDKYGNVYLYWGEILLEKEDAERIFNEEQKKGQWKHLGGKAEPGDYISVTATVSKHTEHHGVAQTEVINVSKANLINKEDL